MMGPLQLIGVVGCDDTETTVVKVASGMNRQIKDEDKPRW